MFLKYGQNVEKPYTKRIVPSCSVIVPNCSWNPVLRKVSAKRYVSYLFYNFVPRITNPASSFPIGVVIFTAAPSIPWRPPGGTICLVVRSASQRLADESAVRAPASSLPWRPPGETICLVVRNASQRLAEGSARAPASSFPWRPPGAVILLSGPALTPAKAPKSNRSHRRA